MACTCESVSSFLLDAWDSLWRQGGFAACDGLRAIAVLWVCGGHALHYAIDFHGYWRMLLPYTNDSAVDLFLVLSGFLIGNALQREVTKVGAAQMSWGIFYVRRFFRIVPAYVSACLVALIVASANLESQSCSRLWQNMLFVNNFSLPASPCIGQSWSVAVEFQLYILTPLFFVLAEKLGNLRPAPWIHVLCATAWLTCCILRFLRVLSLGDSRTSFDPKLYFFTQYRFAPYIAGVSAGVALAQHPTTSSSWPRASMLATACSYVVVFLVWLNGGDFTNSVVPIETMNPVLFLLLSSFLRPLVGIALAWLLTSCTRGQAPWLNAFLGCRFWGPIAALSYSMYLLESAGERFSNWPFLAATSNLSKAIPVQLLRGYAAIALYVSAAMLLAIFNFTLVERPGMLLGKRAVSCLKALCTADSEAKDKDPEAATSAVPLTSVAPAPTSQSSSESETDTDDSGSAESR